MIKSLEQNWRVYGMESICLGLFMLSASVWTIILEFPGSTVHQAIPNSLVRLCINAFAMGATASLLIYSPMGKVSGAHMNPAVTLAFVMLKKIKKTDAIFYVVFQLVGGVAAVSIVALVLRESFTEPPVRYVLTIPGTFGINMALFFETVMSFIMMLAVLVVSNHEILSKYTGIIAGGLVFIFIVISAPISGFSINPARTLASAIPALDFRSIWIYMIAPFIGMLAAARVYSLFAGRAICAKLHHSSEYHCIFNCGYCSHQEQEE